MKKLTFAFACASTLALFANPISVATFEGVAPGFTGLSGKTDAGENGNMVYWQYIGDSGTADSSVVTAYGGENLPAPTGSLSGTPGSNYLNLSTEGGTLWRSVNPDASGLGEAKTIAPDGQMYIDTMVQFTATEDSNGPDMATEDKLAIWLDKSVDEQTQAETLTLCVRAAVVDDAGGKTPTTFKITNAAPEPGTWYRLSVKAFADIAGGDEIPGFEIRLDGNVLIADRMTLTEEYAALIENDDINAKTRFASLRSEPTVQAVGFKGSGAIDDVTITEDELFAPAVPVEFTITTAEGVTASWSKTADGEFTDYAAGAKAEPGTIYVKLATADGGVKIVEQTVAADAENAFDLTSQTVDWSWYLGDVVEGAYVIDNETELEKLAEKAVTLGTDGVTFKLGANIALTKPWAGIGTTNSATDCFKGTFDGQGFKISNVVMKDNGAGKNHYRGFFNQIDGGTVKNLTVESFGFGTTPPSGEYGSAAIAGIANNATIENCVSEGTVASSTHNAGGIVVRIKDTTVKGCTNKANLTGNYTKIAGVVVLCMDSATACLIENCKNEGTLTAVGVDSVMKDGAYRAGSDGVAGIISYVGDGKLTIKDCSNTGALVKGANANSGAKLGQIIGWNHAGVKALEGTITGTTAARMICDMSTPATRHLATVADGVATLVEDSTIAAGGSYMAMATGCTVTLANVNDSITIDTTLADVTVTTTAENAYVAQADNVYTVTAKADAEFTVSIDPTEAEWTAELTLPIPTITGTEATGTWSPAEIVEPDAGKTNVYTYTVTVAATDTTKETTKSVAFKVYKKATVVYPEYITDDTTKGKFDTWANNYNITGDDRKTAPMDAYLLNCAPASVAAEKAKFKIVSIEQNAETGAWTVKVTDGNKVDGDNYGNGTIEIQGATALEGPWAKGTPGAKFFKAVLK